MLQSNPLIHHFLRHLLAAIGSFILLTISLILLAPIFQSALFQLAESLSTEMKNGYIHTAFVDWWILFLLIATTELIRRRISRQELWWIVPVMALLFSVIGFAAVALENWSSLQNREFMVMFASMTQGLHYGLWALFYWAVYVLCGLALEKKS